MALYLVQHGKNLSRDVDPNKGLSDEGVADVTTIATVAAQYGVKVSGIWHSGLTRAQQTAQLFAAKLEPQSEIEEISGIKPLDDVKELAKKIDPDANIMVVGHLPFMEKLTSFLVIGAETPPIFKFQNGGIVCLDKLPDSKSWIIKWSLSPHIG